MSEDVQLQIAKLVDKEEENKKVSAWGQFGKQLYHSQLWFQLRGQEIAAKLIEPITIDKILEAEQAMALVKKDLEKLVEDRKIITARFKSVAQRLMTPEAEVEAAITKNAASILKAKQAQRDAEKTEENKEKELKAIAEHVRIYVADMHASYLQAQAKLISDAYTHALETGIATVDLPAFLDKVRSRINKGTVSTPIPKPAFKYNTKEAVEAHVLQNFNPWTAEQYIEGFNIDLDKKFVDWERALQNKADATKLNKEEYDVTLLAIADNKERETMTAKLEAIAEPIKEAVAGKQLKQVYKIAEPETLDQVFIIINAFTVNRNLCIPQLNKIKPVNIGVKQMIAALEGVKAEDESFAFTGLTFTLTDKL